MILFRFREINIDIKCFYHFNQLMITRQCYVSKYKVFHMTKLPYYCFQKKSVRPKKY